MTLILKATLPFVLVLTLLQDGNAAQHTFQELSQAAKQAREENRQDPAIELYRQALALKPEWDEGLWYLGTLLYEKEQYSEACEVLRRFVAQHPKIGYGWAMLGMDEFQTHDYGRALDHLQRSTALGLGDYKKMASTVFYVTAILLTRSEQFDASMELLFSMVAAGEDTAALVEPIGLAALRLPFLPAEIPGDRRELVRMAGSAALSLQAQKYGEAEKLFSNMEAAYPNEPGVHFLFGAYLLGVRPEDGIKEMQREIEISPLHVPARIRLAEEYVKHQQFDQALSLAQEALRLAPKDVSARLVLGEALVAKGDIAEGTRELEKVRDQTPDMVRARWDLFRAYTAAGRSADASREKEEIGRLSQQAQQH
jgi:predicted Zn-dependent protease